MQQTPSHRSSAPQATSSRVSSLGGTHKQSSFLCHECGVTFDTARSLATHLRFQHAVLDQPSSPSAQPPNKRRKVGGEEEVDLSSGRYYQADQHDPKLKQRQELYINNNDHYPVGSSSVSRPPPLEPYLPQTQQSQQQQQTAVCSMFVNSEESRYVPLKDINLVNKNNQHYSQQQHHLQQQQQSRYLQQQQQQQQQALHHQSPSPIKQLQNNQSAIIETSQQQFSHHHNSNSNGSNGGNMQFHPETMYQQQHHDLLRHDSNDNTMSGGGGGGGDSASTAAPTNGLGVPTEDIWDMDSGQVKRFTLMETQQAAFASSAGGGPLPPYQTALSPLDDVAAWEQQANSYPQLGYPPAGSNGTSPSPAASSDYDDSPKWVYGSPASTGSKDSNDMKRPKSYQCDACDKWFTSSGHLKRHFNTTLHKNAMRHHRPSSGGSSAAASVAQQQQSLVSGPPPLAPLSNPFAHHAALQQQQQHNLYNPSDNGSNGVVSIGNSISTSNKFVDNSTSLNNSISSQNNPSNGSNPAGSSSSSYPVTTAAASADIITVTSSSNCNPPPQLSPSLSAPSPSSNHSNHQQQQQQRGSNPASVINAAASSPSPSPQLSSSSVPITSSPLGYYSASAAAAAAASNNVVVSKATVPVKLPQSGELHHQHQQSDYNQSVNKTVQSNCLGFTGEVSAAAAAAAAAQQQQYAAAAQQQQQAMHDGNNTNCSSLYGAAATATDPGAYADHYMQFGYQNYNGSYSPAESGDPASLFDPSVSPGLYGGPGGYPSDQSGVPQQQQQQPPVSAPPPVHTPRQYNKKPKDPSAGVDPSGDYKCNECNKSFSKMCYLKQHNKSFHNGEKPYKCGQCGKRFPVDALYQEHLAKHAGDKPYKCEVCPKQFNHKTDLRRHMCLHTGEKPFACDVCGKGFIREDRMIKHADTHKKKQPLVM